MQVRLDMLVGDYVRNADRASKATMGIADAAQAPKSALEGLKTVGASLGRTMTAAAGVGAAAMAAWTANAFATGVAYNALQQRAGSALETLLGSAEAATEQMGELAEFARTSPFPRQLWIQAQQQLLGFGIEAEKIVPIFQALQDGIVAVGGSAQQIEEVVLILSKISSVGKVTAEDLNELGVRGIDAATLVGEAWGMTAAEVRDSMSQGAADATEFLDTLVEQLGTKYAGAAAGLRTTWAGALDRIAGATRDFGAVLAEPFVDPDGGGAAVDWANEVADAIRALEAIARPAMEVLSTRAEPAFQAASEAAGRFADQLAEVDLVAVIDRLAEAGPALAAFAASAAAAGSASALSAVNMGGLAAAISPVAAGVTTLALVSPELRSSLVDLVGAFAPLLPVATDLALQLSALISSGAGLAGSILSILAPALSVLVTAITPILQFAAVLAETLDALPGPALAAAAGVLGLVKVLVMLRSFTGSLAIAGALDTVITKASTASTAVGGLNGALKGMAAAGVVGIVIGLANAFDTTADQLERVRSVDVTGLAEDLLRLLNTGQATAGLDALFGSGTDSAEKFVDTMYVASESWWDWSHGLNRSINENSAAEESFEQLDSAMSQLVASGENADAVLNAIAEAYDLNEEEIEVLLGLLPKYKVEADRQAAANADGADAANEHADGLSNLEVQAERTKTSLKTLADEMRAQTDPVFAAIKATRDLSDAQDAYDDAVAEHGKTSDEARDALLDLLAAQSEAASAAGDLADITGGDVPPELLALAEAANISSDELDWLIDQFHGAQGAGEDFQNAFADITADITTDAGRMKVQNALELADMEEGWASFVIDTKIMVDDLIGKGYSYEEALAIVAQRTNRSQELIEDGFNDARAAGLEFSDDYPASVSLSGDDDVALRIKAVKSLLKSVDRTVTIAFDYTASGDWRQFIPKGGASVPYAFGGPVPGPVGAGDIVPAMLSPGEHVWTPEEVQAAGGHDAMAAMRAAVLAGQTGFAQSSPVVVHSAPAMGHGRGITVNNLNVEAVNERLDMRQVRNELTYLAVS